MQPDKTTRNSGLIALFFVPPRMNVTNFIRAASMADSP